MLLLPQQFFVKIYTQVRDFPCISDKYVKLVKICINWFLSYQITLICRPKIYNISKIIIKKSRTKCAFMYKSKINQIYWIALELRKYIQFSTHSSSWNSGKDIVKINYSSIHTEFQSFHRNYEIQEQFINVSLSPYNPITDNDNLRRKYSQFRMKTVALITIEFKIRNKQNNIFFQYLSKCTKTRKLMQIHVWDWILSSDDKPLYNLNVS